MTSDVRLKTCIRCCVAKPTSDFYGRKRADGSTFLRGTCKVCMARESAEARKADPERFRVYSRRYFERIPRRTRMLWEKYRLTPEDWDAMWAAQNYACAICLGASGDESTHVDHDHVTGENRAILCGLCNRMLGQGQDDADRLEAGARYLREWAA